MCRQVLDPVNHSLGLTSVFAALPLVVLFVLLGLFRVRAWLAALVSLAVALVVATVVYPMPVGQAVLAGTEGPFVALGWTGLACLVAAGLVVLVAQDAPRRPPAPHEPTGNPYRTPTLYRLHAASALLVLPLLALGRHGHGRGARHRSQGRRVRSVGTSRRIAARDATARRVPRAQPAGDVVHACSRPERDAVLSQERLQLSVLLG